MLLKVLRVAVRLLAITIVGWGTIAVAAEAVSRSKPPRGRMVDVGGHQLRLVCEGPRSERPVVWMEAGAFSGAADFAAIQQKLTAKGYRSCAYDRAGMGYSQAGPRPRDGNAIVGDLKGLMAASAEAGPYVLMGHSMAGLYLHQFAAQHPDQVVGLVLLDAVTPELLQAPGVGGFADRMHDIARLGSAAGTLGLTKPLYWWGDRIGLPPQGKAEKRRGFVSGRQSRTAYAEVQMWRAAGEQAAAAGALSPQWPVAVITAGPSARGSAWGELRQAPARRSAAPMVVAIAGANHRTMLGLVHGDHAVAGVEHVVERRSSGAR